MCPLAVAAKQEVYPMYVEREGGRLEATSQERRDPAQQDARILGHVVHCDGARATIAAFVNGGDGAAEHWTVGRMISINLNEARTVGLVYAVDTAGHQWEPDARNPIEVHVELIGEVRDIDGKPVFDRGITIYPCVGAITHRIRARDLQAVFDLGGRPSVQIGHLSQDEKIEARISVRDTLQRHFAFVGTTGVGKSTAVSLLLRKAVAARPGLRVLILDPHNEFAGTFPGQVERIDVHSLDLPFWIFRLEELVEVFYRGREPVAEELELLRDLIPTARQMMRGGGQPQIRRSNDAGGITADTPIPYRMQDVIRLIDDRMGQLDAKHERPFLRMLRARIDSALNDPRYRFMFQSRVVEDTLHQTIGRIFRIPHEGRPITCFEMAGMPGEVVNSVCSVLARLAFDLAVWSEGKFELLMLCEEAHRYLPADARLGFAPTRHALARIAKEGRKYGCYLGVVTQRPGELDPTILSQCSTVFAMRLANEVDQDIIRSAIADSSASSLSFLSSMGQREAIAFGDGVAATMRLKFERLSPSFIPGALRKEPVGEQDGADESDLMQMVRKLRNLPREAEPVDPFMAEPLAAPRPADPLYQRPSVAPQPEPNPYGRRAYDNAPGLFRR